ncbi:MAG: tyrosine-type recombinase/integrase [Thiotrichales bacterium]|nr:tyrosine-type recombinase/integrase [Thiotrichales bacterium]
MERQIPEDEKKGGRRLRNALNERAVRGAKQPGRYFDGHGLFLLVEASGAKRWKQRLTVGGHRQELGLGPYPVVTLAMARETALTNQREIRNGENPKTNRRRARGVRTFAEAERKVFELRRSGWKGESHAKDWTDSMRLHVLPRLGASSVADISTEDVIAVLSPIWHARPVTAKRVRQRIAAVFAWAIAQGLRPDNPADSARTVLARQPNGSKAQRSLPYAEVASAIAVVRSSNVAPVLSLAFEFLILTAARSREVREATWNELDLEAAIWTVPAHRMKAGREHRVPLSGHVVEILTSAWALRSKHSDLVFPTRGGRPIGNTAFVQALRRLGIDATAHGFRASFRVWAQERTNIPREVCEAALAHTIRDKAEAAYARSDLFEKRRDLMERWARYLDPQPADVVNLGAHREAGR